MMLSQLEFNQLIQRAASDDAALSALITETTEIPTIRNFIREQRAEFQDELFQTARITTWRAVREGRWKESKGREFVNFILIATQWMAMNLRRSDWRQSNLKSEYTSFSSRPTITREEEKTDSILFAEKVLERCRPEVVAFLSFVGEGYTYRDAMGKLYPEMPPRQRDYKAQCFLEEAKEISLQLEKLPFA